MSPDIYNLIRFKINRVLRKCYCKKRNIRWIFFVYYNEFSLTDVTAGGQLYTWGSNSKGQLGLGPSVDHVFVPTLVESIVGVPLAGLTCGGEKWSHTFCFTCFLPFPPHNGSEIKNHYWSKLGIYVLNRLNVLLKNMKFKERINKKCKMLNKETRSAF